jgi:hypothetical protein
MSLTLSLLATVAMVIEPITPSIAQSVGSTVTAPRAKHAIAKPIGRSFIITPKQWDSLATTSPALHSKLLKVRQTGGSLDLTAEEKATLKVLTYSNLSSFRP